MTDSELQEVRDRVQRQKDQLEDVLGFIGNMEFYRSRMRDAGGDPITIETKVGGALSFVEVSLAADFDHAENAPTEILDRRGWDKASLKPHSDGARMYVNERIDLR